MGAEDYCIHYSDIKALQIVNSNFIPNKKQLPKKEEPPIFVALERGLNASA